MACVHPDEQNELGGMCALTSIVNMGRRGRTCLRNKVKPNEPLRP